MRIKDYFDEHLEYLKMKGKTSDCVNRRRRYFYGSIWHTSIKDKRISQLRLSDMAELVESGRVHGEYGPRYTIITFRMFLKYLKERGIKIPFDWREIEVPVVPKKEITFLTKVELKKLLSSIPIDTKFGGGLRERALLETLFATGMRISEVLSLTLAQFNRAKRTHEAIIKSAKCEDERIVYFTDRCLYWLSRYVKNRRNVGLPHLFVNCWGTGSLKMTTAKSFLIHRQKEWDVDQQITHHLFRRTAATFLLERGADIKSVQHILGHKSERTTLRYYAVINKKHAKKVHQKLMRI